MGQIHSGDGFGRAVHTKKRQRRRFALPPTIASSELSSSIDFGKSSVMLPGRSLAKLEMQRRIPGDASHARHFANALGKSVGPGDE